MNIFEFEHISLNVLLLKHGIKYNQWCNIDYCTTGYIYLVSYVMLLTLLAKL